MKRRHYARLLAGNNAGVKKENINLCIIFLHFLNVNNEFSHKRDREKDSGELAAPFRVPQAPT